MKYSVGILDVAGVDSLQRACFLSWGAFLLIWSFSANAGVDVGQPADPAAVPRYRALIEEMRCPKCQNQNLADSDAPIAADLRREIRRLLDNGSSDQQIIDEMTARYGEFVLYRPRWQRTTWLLWLTPAILLALAAGAAIWVVVRQRRRASVVLELDASEATAFQEILDRTSGRRQIVEPEPRQ